MKHSDRTNMGGKNVRFRTTNWTEIHHAKTYDETQRRVIINNIIKNYWKPVYCYIRGKGYSNESAKDLTQGFFHEIFLGRGLVEKADRSKGKFRTFILTCLDRYLIDVHHHETASKRSPNGLLFQLDEIDLSEMPTILSDATPEQNFHYAYVLELLENVLLEVKDECYNIERKIHWEVFYDRLLVPILNDVAPPSLSDICKKYNIKSGTVASNMIVTVKRRLRKALERRLRRFSHTNSDVEKELSELLKYFPKIAQDRK